MTEMVHLVPIQKVSCAAESAAPDAAKVQSVGARFAQKQITVEYAAEVGCRGTRITRGGHAVGQLVGSCTAVAVGQSGVDELCEFVLRLGSAQLTAAGTVHAGPQGPGTFTLPVVGGSGSYRGASGQIAVTATDSSTLPITVSQDR